MALDKESFKKCLISMANSFPCPDIQGEDAAKALEDLNPEEFNLFMAWPISEQVNEMIKARTESPTAMFIMQHGGFIEGHINKIIDKIEGFGCGADKTRTIIRAAVRYYAEGDPINFNYTGKYTYHLPTIVFRTQEQIIDFIDSLQSLYYGNPEKYLIQLSEIYKPDKD